MNKPKRVWSDKSPVFSNKKPVWKLWDKLGVYDPTFTEVESWAIYPSNRWQNLENTDNLEIYDSLNPTEIGNFKDWIVATYVFEDYDGTEISTGTVNDWGTPTAPTDPTREWYTFTGWTPEVWPISENTTYVATYEENAPANDNSDAES